MSKLNLDELLPKIEEGLKRHYSYEVMGPAGWGEIAGYFDALTERGFKVRTNSHRKGNEESQITLYVDRKEENQNA